MLAKRIIPCLDVKNNKVIKGIQFKNHKIVGDIVTLAERYAYEGADELVFYDIEASLNNKTANKYWIKKIAQVIDIPFCVAGGIKTIQQAQEILEFGADKISINTPALIQPELITKLAKHFGTQCIVVGIDSWYNQKEKTYQVKCYTGNYACMKTTIWSTKDWVKKVQELGAGEIVLNMMNQDGTKQGYDINQLRQIKKNCKVPLIASGGAGTYEHFLKIFHDNYADGALAASVFHKNAINIFELKKFLIQKGIKIRLC